MRSGIRTPRAARMAGYLTLSAVDIALSGAAGPAARRARRITKPLLMPALIAASSTAPGPGRHRSTRLAQVLSWGGDVALLGSGSRPFVAGTACFGLAHVAYTAGFLSDRDATRPLRDLPTTRPLLAVWAVTAPVLALRARRKEPVLGPAVAAYSGLLTAMAVTAQGTRSAPGRRRMTALGAMLFLVSDTLLGFRTFVSTDPPPGLERLVMASYTGAQLLLSEGAGG